MPSGKLCPILLTGGSSAPPVFTPTTTTTAGLAGGAPGAVASPTTTLPGTGGQVYTSKDPFAPLVNANAGSAAGSGSSSASGTWILRRLNRRRSTATTSTTVGGASGAGAAPGGSTSPTSGQEVQVLDVYASGKSTAATIQVAGAQYQVSPGTTFAAQDDVVDLSVEISVLHESPLGHLRYGLTDVPPQPNSPPDNVFNPDQPSKDLNARSWALTPSSALLNK